MKKLCAIVLSFALIFSNVGLMALAVETNEGSDSLKGVMKRVENSSQSALHTKSLDENAEITVIVELDGSALLDAPGAKTMGAKGYLETAEAKAAKVSMRGRQDKVKESIKKIDKDAKIEYSYVNLLNGFSVETKVKYVSAISKLSGVQSVSRSIVYDLPTPKMVNSVGMVFPDTKTTHATYKGEGAIVAVIDTGVDVDHELMMLSDEKKVKLTKDNVSEFLKKNDMQAEIKEGWYMEADEVYKNPKFPFCYDYADSDPDPATDGEDHGAHVSGTVAANGTAAKKAGKTLSTKYPFDGVAPEAQILGLKVFPSKGGGAKTKDTVAAIEDAITLGADSINLSLGSPAGFTYLDNPNFIANYEYAPVFKKAREAGVLIAAAAGNDYRTGDGGLNLYGEDPLAANPDDALVGSPSTNKLATSVASVDNTQVIESFMKADGKEVFYKDVTYPADYKSGTFAELLDGKGEVEYVMCGKGFVEGDDPTNKTQNDFKDKDLKDKIAVVQRGTSNFTKKVQNAKNAGAIACIIYNNAKDKNEALGATLAGVKGNTLIPTITITRAAGEALIADGGKIEAKKGDTKLAPYGDGTRMSSFSSWGCSPDLSLKPEITAPGGQIYSTISDNKYEYYSGTSMATPHVAGGMALVQEFAGKNDGLKDKGEAERTQILEALLMSTATVLEDKKSEAPHSPRLQGAGLMNLDAALKKDAVYLINDDTQKAKVELKSFEDNKKEFKFKVVNTSNVEKKYDLSADVLVQNSKDGKDLLFEKTTKLTDTTMRKLEKSNITFNVNGTTATDVSVKGGEEVEVTATLIVDPGEMADQKKIFTNGFFVEGYVYLKGAAANSEDTAKVLSLPYMGFYGKWADVPVFDGATAYLEDIVKTGKVPYFTNTRATMSISLFGMNFNIDSGVDLSEKKDGSEYVGFNPSNTIMPQSMTWVVDTFRNVKTMDAHIVNNKDVVVRSGLINRVDGNYVTKSYFYSNGGYVIPGIEATWDGKDDKGKVVEAGQYYMVFEGTPDCENATPQKSMKFPVIVDTKKPTASAYYDELSGEVVITAEDDYYLDYLVVDLATADGEDDYTGYLKYEKKSTYKVSADKFADPSKLVGSSVYVLDEALNETEIEIVSRGKGKVYEGVYDGKEHELVTITDTNITAKYSTDGKTFTDTVPKATDAGEYPITMKLNGGGYEDTEIKTVAKITPVGLTATVTIADKEYDGTTDGTVSEVTFDKVVEGETLVQDKDYIVKATFKSAEKDWKIPVTVTFESKNPNYTIKSPVETVGNIVDKTYTITFKNGGGTGTDPVQAPLTEGSKFNLPANPYTRDGYTFTGWNDGTKIYQVGEVYKVGKANVEFTAQWSADGYDITGEIVSFGDEKEEAKLELQKEGETKVYTTSGTKTYKFEEKIPAGKYTLKVMKSKHATREYTVKVENSPITQKVEIYLLGDVDMNGKFTMLDIQKLFAFIKDPKTLTDDYQQKLGDVDDNGAHNMLDIQKIFNLIKAH